MASIGVLVYQDRLVLSYRSKSGSKWEDVKEPVPMEWTACNFGGERPWFVCPGMVNGKRCSRRVAILYGLGRYFLCRHCYDLRCESQREDKGHRALRRAQRIRQRLGGNANMTEPFPEKSKGMAPRYLHEAVLGAPRGRVVASRQHAEVAGQAPKTDELEGFVRRFGKREQET